MIGAIEWRQWRQWRQSNGANGANGAKRRPMAPGLFLLGKRILFDASSPDPPVVLRHSDVASMDPVDATWHLLDHLGHRHLDHIDSFDVFLVMEATINSQWPREALVPHIGNHERVSLIMHVLLLGSRLWPAYLQSGMSGNQLLWEKRKHD